MPAMSRGRIENQTSIFRSKGDTQPSRKHHFESFTKRIAKLNIDPIRRTRRYDFASEGLSTTTSYFKSSLVDWDELNLSENYTAFSRTVHPLCESLPQILHYGDRIADLLVEYIEKADSYSLEPLLSLVSHFAHDLGATFEKHFSRVVSTVSHVAAEHPDVEVIEWSFTCLAWLFKYLSRLLVPDLRPVYDLVAPLLGKSRQKSFITRFAAEALSFLIRKAGSIYHRDKAPLERIVTHVFQDLEGTSDNSDTYQYQQGIMTLFADSIKGVGKGVHSAGPAILSVLINYIFRDDVEPSQVPKESLDEEVVRGILIAVIHHTDSKTFKQLAEVLLTEIGLLISTKSGSRAAIATRIILVMSSVRKGTRLEDWSLVFEITSELVNIVGEMLRSNDASLSSSVVSAVASVFHYGPLDLALLHIRVVENIAKCPWGDEFLSFCNAFAELDRDRFDRLVLSYFQRFIVRHWQDNIEKLCILVPKLSGLDHPSKTKITCPASWQAHIIQVFQEWSSGERLEHHTYLCDGLLKVFRNVSVESEPQDSVRAILLDCLSNSETSKTITMSPATAFIFGNGMRYASQTHPRCLLESSYWDIICRHCDLLWNMPLFWEVVQESIKQHEEGPRHAPVNLERILPYIFRGLCSSSHILRSQCLNTFASVMRLTQGEVSEVVLTAIIIENLSFDVQNLRSLSMYIRKLSSDYRNILSNNLLAKAVVSYCFGLLHVKLSQIWEDACAALKEICLTKEGELIVTDIVFDWIREGGDIEQSQNPQAIKTPLDPDSKSFMKSFTTEFQCTNLLKDQTIIQQSILSTVSALDTLQYQFEKEHARVPSTNSNCRTQGLRVLNAIPQIAEKRSRMLVPVLLDWALSDSQNLPVPQALDAGDVDAYNSPNEHNSRWTRKDQKSMLSLFVQFVNPRALFKSDEVFSALLSLLSNGDVEIQRVALKAILTWKIDSINRYEENLFNLLDDVRFRDQVSVFLDLGHDDSSLQDEDRSQLMPVLLRLLYGKVITRAGSASGKRGQESKRKAVFIALSRLGSKDMNEFLKIAMGTLYGLPIENNRDLTRHGLLDTRKQLGLLNMLEDMLETLGVELNPFTDNIIGAVLLCLFQSNSRLTPSSVPNQNNDLQSESLHRSIRQVGYRCLNSLFSNNPKFEWDKYIPEILEQLVNPRLETLPVETAQSVSGILRMFSIWSTTLHLAPFLNSVNNKILPTVVNCLDVPSAKDEVKLFVINNILINLARIAGLDSSSNLSQNDQWEYIRTSILPQHTNHVLTHIGSLLRKSPSKDILEAAIEVVSELASFVQETDGVYNLVDIAAYLLQQPVNRVSVKTKINLLQVLGHFIPICHPKSQNILLVEVYKACTPLFASFQDRFGRELLCGVLEALAQKNEELSQAAQLCTALNSYSKTRLDEPDFDGRSKAFNLINEDLYPTLSMESWRPILFNMLFFIKDTEELVIRTNASFSLRRFVETSCFDGDNELKQRQELLDQVVLTGIYEGVRHQPELVRVEYLSIVNHAVQHLPTWETVSDMRPLLVDGDDEASFFTNILHIQLHRRLRALRRLAKESKTANLHSKNVSHFLIPLIEHYIFDQAEDTSAHNLAAEAVNTIGVLSMSLEWPQFRAIFRRYTGYMNSKPELAKTTVKLLSLLVDSLDRATQAKGYISTKHFSLPANSNERAQQDEWLEAVLKESKLVKTIPSQEKLSQELVNNILPPLTIHVRNKDESTVSLRVPVAVAVVKLLKMLGLEEFNQRLPPVLMDMAHILRSRAQESRDMVRRTLVDVAILIGPEYLEFIIKELRSALLRGYQLHVLSFTVHSILVSMSETLQPGDLDSCLNSIVTIIMDDIFGTTGQEKDAEEYISKMKEVKSSKSYDSMELIAKVTSTSHLVKLVQPVKALLQEKLDLKTVRKIDELLRRVGLGISHNNSIEDRAILVFCYEIIKDAYKNGENPSKENLEDYRTRRYLVAMKSANKSITKGATTSHVHKIIRFSLDILRTILHKHDSLRTPENISGFMPVIGDALVQGQEEVQMASIRLLTTIIKVPLPDIDANSKVYISEAVRIIRGVPSMNSEIAQAALKLVSAILRERRRTEVKEADLSYLLLRLNPDLEEPDRQGVTFNFIKAIMSRKIVIVELYEVLDTVASIMVTNQTRTSRDLARAVYFQFLMEYPQGKDRLAKQLAFLVKNLEYKYIEGRQSIMEAINLIFNKVGDDIIQEMLSTMFVPLVMVMVNDESSDCRGMAGMLVKKIFERAGKESMKSFSALLRTWLTQTDRPLLRRVALQCWTFYFEIGRSSDKQVNLVLNEIDRILNQNTSTGEDSEWEILYYALQSFAKLCELSPNITFQSANSGIWSSVHSCLSFPHAWVKLSAARLVGLFFQDIGSTNAKDGLSSVPLNGSGGLQLTADDMLRLTAASTRMLKVSGVTEEITNQTARNLVFLGRCFDANNLCWKYTHQEDEESEDDEDGIEDDNESSRPKKKTALQYLFERLSWILRRDLESNKSPSLYPKTASLQLVAALCNGLSKEALTPSLFSILLPLHNLTDTNVPAPHSSNPAFTNAYKALKDTAAETMGIVQQKLGTTEYVAALQKVRDAVREKREGRRIKRRIEAVRDPEKWGREKRKKTEAKKAKRKEVAAEARGRRRGW
ncbi:hypothetical protein M501DRAFT_1060702 [Patellaria atrata CBS 101060]|uniref:HEAT repeat protein n=1 Tax=Patellaria atrata CBS 101060 TaxID=1346257 RepID=A0A9P4S5S4_9PEZI|nr:hypothetical protein M501DRAFT_1060702 [Patellaria atrata CBS 101060]